MIPYTDRPTDMLQRQLLANRKAARLWVEPGNGRRWKYFAHAMPYRPHFVRDIVAMRDELKRRGVTRLRP